LTDDVGDATGPHLACLREALGDAHGQSVEVGPGDRRGLTITPALEALRDRDGLVGSRDVREDRGGVGGFTHHGFEIGLVDPRQAYASEDLAPVSDEPGVVDAPEQVAERQPRRRAPVLRCLLRRRHHPAGLADHLVDRPHWPEGGVEECRGVSAHPEPVAPDAGAVCEFVERSAGERGAALRRCAVLEVVIDAEDDAAPVVGIDGEAGHAATVGQFDGLGALRWDAHEHGLGADRDGCTEVAALDEASFVEGRVALDHRVEHPPPPSPSSPLFLPFPPVRLHFLQRLSPPGSLREGGLSRGPRRCARLWAR
jgi:hypothetical protein